MKRPRVLLADDHAAAVDGYRRILLPECDIVHAARDGLSALDAAERSQPDIVVMDISMPGVSGLEASRRLRNSMPDVKVILISAHADPVFICGAFQAGAWGYLLKHQAAAELPAAVRRASAGQLYLSPSAFALLWDDEAAGPQATETLTERQRELVILVGRGLTTKQIAAAMEVSFQTVVRRRKATMRGLGITQPGDLLRYAIRCRLAE